MRVGGEGKIKKMENFCFISAFISNDYFGKLFLADAKLDSKQNKTKNLWYASKMPQVSFCKYFILLNVEDIHLSLRKSVGQ